MVRNIKILITFVLILLSNVVYSQTLGEVRDYINDSTDIKHKDIVLRQSIQETGWYKCKNCSMDKNNIFGWYYKGKYLSFTHWKESVLYYERWQNRHYVDGDYYEFLIKRGYASDPEYINRLKNIKLDGKY